MWRPNAFTYSLFQSTLQQPLYFFSTFIKIIIFTHFLLLCFSPLFYLCKPFSVLSNWDTKKRSTLLHQTTVATTLILSHRCVVPKSLHLLSLHQTASSPSSDHRSSSPWQAHTFFFFFSRYVTFFVLFFVCSNWWSCGLIMIWFALICNC